MSLAVERFAFRFKNELLSEPFHVAFHSLDLYYEVRNKNFQRKKRKESQYNVWYLWQV